MKKIPRAVKRTTTAQSLHASGQCESCCCKELAALRKDKMRLDTLTRLVDRDKITVIFWPDESKLKLGKCYQGTSVRSAIDAYIRKASRSGGKR